jgi:adenylate cyclase
MEKKYKQREIDNIRFSIGKKLVMIISIMVIISLGSITALASWIIYEFFWSNAEGTNEETNRRSAAEAETTFANVQSNSKILVQTITDMGAKTASIEAMKKFFFKENPQIAAVYYITPGKSQGMPVNSDFFKTEKIDEGLAASYFSNQGDALSRAIRNGETILLNAAPYFSKAVLALFFPWKNAEGQNVGVYGVLFSSEALNTSYGTGASQSLTSQSFMINSRGDILVAGVFESVLENRNIANEVFIREILDSTKKSEQHTYISDLKFLQGDRSVVNTNFFAATWANARPALQFIADHSTDAVNKIFKTNYQKKQLGNSWKNEKGDVVMRLFVAFTKLDSVTATVITCIEHDRVFEGIFAITRRNIYLTVAVLSFSIIFIWFFSKTISIPIRALAVAARSIEGGEFKIELKQKGGDEIGILTNSFQRMSNALNVFGKFTNRDVAVKAMRGQIKPGGLPKHATVFFSDIRNFTAISETFTNTFGGDSSDRIVFWLNNYFTQMVDCVEKTNGVVDKFIGDAVMAHWGTAYSAGSPRKDAFNCVMAALMMRKALYNLNKGRKKDDPSNPVIRIGCGINTGIVTAGQIGSDLRMEYTVIGDPVNLASRVESLNKPLGTDILITEDTWKLVGSKFITEEMPPVTVKGKESAIRIFAVVNHIENNKGPFTLADLRELLGIEPPQLSKVDVNADEKKYKIGAAV